MKQKYFQSGFTLIELIITLAIAAILVTTAVPSFTTLMQNNRLITEANQFIAAINLARSEAVKRGGRVVLCKSSNGTSCDTSSTGWEQGWVVFVDADSNNSLGGGDTVVRQFESLSSGNTLVGHASNGNYGAAENFITYNGGGYSTASNKLELILCDSRNDLSVARGVRITSSGRPNTVDGPELNSGLSCT